MDPSSQVLRTLAARYENRQAGRTGHGRVTIDYEELLREAEADRGEARICAERDLAEAHTRGLLTLETHRRTNLPLRVRFEAKNEKPLFEMLHLLAPTERRRALAALFEQAARQSVPAPWQAGWEKFCAAHASVALEGSSLAPFGRDRTDEIREILTLLPGLLAWQTESLRRFASSRLCRDSKRLEALQTRLTTCLNAITAGAIRSLEDLGIVENERAVIIQGPLRLLYPEGVLDLGLLTAPARIDRRDLGRARFETSAARCLVVENLSVLHELAGRRANTLLASSGSEGGFAHSAIVEFLTALPEAVTCWHCGDTDPKGFEILLNLRERLNRPLLSLGMTFDGSRPGPPLTQNDSATVVRLLALPHLTAVEKSQLIAQQTAGHKGVFEQEARPLPD